MFSHLSTSHSADRWDRYLWSHFLSRGWDRVDICGTRFLPGLGLGLFMCSSSGYAQRRGYVNGVYPEG